MRNSIVQISAGSLIKEFIKKALDYKLFYITCIILFILIAIMINKYSNEVYEVNASILLTQNDRSSLLNSNELFKGMDILQNNKNIDNELTMLTSFALVSSTITSLNLEVGYYHQTEGLLGIRSVEEMYQEAPFTVNIDKSHIQPIDVNFYIEILNDSTFRLSASKDEVALYNYVDNEVEDKRKSFDLNAVYKFNQTVSNNSFRFSVTLDQKKFRNQDPDSKFFFKFHHLDYLTMQYLKEIKVEPVSPLASIINITYRGENLRKIIAFMNKYLDLYLSSNLDKKNKASVSTIQFIDSQISQISDSLVTSESKLRDYRTANQVTDLSFQGQRIYDQMSQLETEKANLEIQKRYYNYIIDYFDKNKDVSSVVPPSTMNVADPIMNQLITELISLNAERSNILNGNSNKNLFLGQIENKIKMQRQTILENVRNNLNTINLSINELNYRYEKMSGEISKLPRTEIRLVGMERKFKLNDVIYTFLLQKRAEAEISRASNYPDYEILNPARSITSNVILPMRNVNLMLAFFLALLIPTLFILIKDFFNDKLISTFEIEHISDHKVLGVIYRSRHKSEAVVAERPRSSVSESFRKLRTNILIKPKTGSSHTVLITSSMPFEGKSFVAFNLAASFASIGYKTLIIDFDLRRPVLHDKFNVDNSIGLSPYLVNKALADDIIVKSFVPNLFFMPAGPVLPNPAELIESGACDKLFNYLKNNFDYIVIDSPPLGAVADSYLLMKYATLTLLVTRQNYTRKEAFIEVIKGLETNNLSNYEIVFNDMNFKKGMSGHYYTKYYNEEKISDKKGNPLVSLIKSKISN